MVKAGDEKEHRIETDYWLRKSHVYTGQQGKNKRPIKK